MRKIHYAKGQQETPGLRRDLLAHPSSLHGLIGINASCPKIGQA
jgi:hypothetical protein